jgi:hypothetical protein
MSDDLQARVVRAILNTEAGIELYDSEREEIAAAVVDEMSSWATLMDLLDLHYSADIFPTLPDTPNRDPGPRIVSLIRTVDQLRARLDETKAADQ